ncbi:MAG: class I SAM-dependent methyltransferase [Clostridiales bacterium]|nr:class I SAM-dependent methyltransferase [Clostridiales bacterium]
MKQNVKKIRDEWTNDAAAYALDNHSDEVINKIVVDPSSAFHKTTWEVILSTIPSFDGLKLCVPSSGDNHAVFAFALMGAKVTSCDITEKQLENAAIVADRLNLNIDFICSDTMQLDNIESNEFDFVYTSNGVHVWIDDLESMYRNIFRIMKNDAVYIMFEVHPFCRPFADDTSKLIVEKSYNETGPFKDGTRYHWRIQDIMNAMIKSDLNITRVAEAFAPDYTYWENWWEKIEISEVEKARLMDHKTNPMVALPQTLILSAKK